MPVALRWRGLGRRARHRAGTRWHDDRRLGMARGDTAVNTLLIIRAVADQRGDKSVYLVEQGTNLRAVIEVLLHLCAPSLTGYSSEHGETAAGGFGKAGSGFQGSAVHGRGDPLGGPLVSDVPNQLPRPRTHAGRPRR